MFGFGVLDWFDLLGVVCLCLRSLVVCVPFGVAVFCWVWWYGLVGWCFSIWDLRVGLVWFAGLLGLGAIAGFDWSFGGGRGCLMLVVLVDSGWWFEADLFPSCGCFVVCLL